MNPQMHWSAVRVSWVPKVKKRLAELISQSPPLSAREIASVLQKEFPVECGLVTRNAVIGKLSRLGWKLQLRPQSGGSGRARMPPRLPVNLTGIRAARIRRGLTIKECARVVGASPAIWTRWETDPYMMRPGRKRNACRHSKLSWMVMRRAIREASKARGGYQADLDEISRRHAERDRRREAHAGRRG